MEMQIPALCADPKYPKAFPVQPSNIVSPVCPGSSSGSPPGRTCQEHLLREVSQGHLKQPPQLAPFRCGGAAALLWAPTGVTELLTLSLREHPATLLRKLISAVCIRDLIRSPPPRSASPEALYPTAMQCCRDVSVKTAPQHPETWGTQGSHPPPVPCIPSTTRQCLQSRSTAPLLHHKQCWWRTASPFLRRRMFCQNFFEANL